MWKKARREPTRRPPAESSTALRRRRSLRRVTPTKMESSSASCRRTGGFQSGAGKGKSWLISGSFTLRMERRSQGKRNHALKMGKSSRKTLHNCHECEESARHAGMPQSLLQIPSTKFVPLIEFVISGVTNHNYFCPELSKIQSPYKKVVGSITNLVEGIRRHGKFETLGAIGISCMLLTTAGGIAWHAVNALQSHAGLRNCVRFHSVPEEEKSSSAF
ncbi:uncharacterized protein A4U43_C05F27930 [Asparagus officinalis]|uniref:Uncharacterized protein n=1 Tax=Asparagus officinalis TaxID=4686 RepID=A0A5P1EZI1_ASPOF|nr:uncharacterized protein A4U43_C05F27930 [Asparagus officinalis]